MNAYEAARLIDISAVRTHHTLSDIEELVRYGRQYRFINLHVLPSWVATLAGMIDDLDDVYVGAPVGFPGGGHRTETKLLEAKHLIDDGVDEMDIVMNIGRFRNGEYSYVLDELGQLVDLARGKVRMTKVIIEINTLTDEEMLKACELVRQSGADFVKTGTGWVPGGANVERIRKMKAFCGSDLKIKAAGGIRTYEEFKALCDMGVERMGINTKSAIEIIQTAEAARE